MLSNARAASRFLPLLLAFGVAACSERAPDDGAPAAQSAAESAAEGDSSRVIAEVEGRPITIADVDERIREGLFESEFASQPPPRQYEMRRRTLDQMIADLVLETAAEDSGQSPQAVLEQAQEALGPVRDEEIAAFFEDNKGRLPEGTTLEDVEPQIEQVLSQQRAQQARASLREEAAVSVDFEPPRTPVEPRGPARGPEDAPVTIVAFEDYQCPYCRRMEPTLDAIFERFPGKVRLVHRHLPLVRIHPLARPAAEAAVCAEKQGRFWELHERMFDSGKLSREDIRAHAEAAELDLEAFESCLQEPSTRARVQEDMRAAEQAGVSGTPAFFVNGIRLDGARPLEEFVRVIEEELASGESGAS